ncbi:MAG: N-acyl homoserine lactonase family protein [Gemmatimonadaceae bacterium]
MRWPRAAGLTSSALALLLTVACARPGGTPTPLATGSYAVYAVRFATLPQFRVRGLIAGADSTRRIDVPVMVWALRTPQGRTILFDSGFHRQKFIDQWKVPDFVAPDSALRRAGIDPSTVTDIVLSHIHWDHADGVDLFPKARIWLQREEFEYYVGAGGEPLKPAIDRDVSAILREAMRDGRVQLIEGTNVEVLPGIRVFTGGKHTFASEWASVQTPTGIVVLASDNAYLYENFERHVPIAQTLDADSNLRAQAAMFELAGSLDRIVPGHDPSVLTRFPSAGIGAVRVR